MSETLKVNAQCYGGLELWYDGNGESGLDFYGTYVDLMREFEPAMEDYRIQMVTDPGPVSNDSRYDGLLSEIVAFDQGLLHVDFLLYAWRRERLPFIDFLTPYKVI